MKNEKTSWMQTAVAAPMLYAACRSGWASMLVWMPLLLLGRICSYDKERRWLQSLQWIWYCMVTGVILGDTAINWPGKWSELIVPLVIAALAVSAVWNGIDAAAICGGALRWIVLPGFCLLLLAGLRSVEIKNLEPRLVHMEEMGMVTVLLLAAAREQGPRDLGKNAGLALMSAVICMGVIGTGGTVLDYSRTITLRTVSIRMESIAASIMTVSYFTMIIYCIVQAETVEEREDRGNKKRILIFTAIAYALSFVNRSILKWMITAAGIVLWILVPLVTNVLEKEIEKREKSA